MSVPFGKPMREAHFNFAAPYVPLNHGSFGAFPDTVRDYQRSLQSETEARPDTYIRYTYPKLLLEARQAVAPLLGADTEEVVFVPNALSGINTVLRNLTYVSGDVILYFTTIYGGCLATIRSLEETTPVRSHRIDLVYDPVPDDDEIVRRAQAAILEVRRQGKRPVLAIFDTVLTFPGVRLPWESLTRLYRQNGVLTCIDAAHGIGNIDLTHLGKVGPDFVISNCYKWLMVPRGCAILYVPRRNQPLIKTSYPTDGRYLPSSDRERVSPAAYFSNLFEHVSTIDTSPYLSVLAALDFRNRVCGGETRIRDYCIGLAKEGGQLMAKLMGTEVLPLPQGSAASECCFTNVRLPLEVGHGGDGIPEANAQTVAFWITDKTVSDFDTYLPVRYDAGGFLCRVSAQIYLELPDFAWAAGALLELCVRARRGDWKTAAEDIRNGSGGGPMLEYR